MLEGRSLQFAQVAFFLALGKALMTETAILSLTRKVRKQAGKKGQGKRLYWQGTCFTLSDSASVSRLLFVSMFLFFSCLFFSACF